MNLLRNYRKNTRTGFGIAEVMVSLVILAVIGLSIFIFVRKNSRSMSFESMKYQEVRAFNILKEKLNRDIFRVQNVTGASRLNGLNVGMTRWPDWNQPSNGNFDSVKILLNEYSEISMPVRLACGSDPSAPIPCTSATDVWIRYDATSQGAAHDRYFRENILSLLPHTHAYVTLASPHAKNIYKVQSSTCVLNSTAPCFIQLEKSASTFDPTDFSNYALEMRIAKEVQLTFEDDPQTPGAKRLVRKSKGQDEVLADGLLKFHIYYEFQDPDPQNPTRMPLPSHPSDRHPGMYRSLGDASGYLSQCSIGASCFGYADVVGARIEFEKDLGPAVESFKGSTDEVLVRNDRLIFTKTFSLSFSEGISKSKSQSQLEGVPVSCLDPMRSRCRKECASLFTKDQFGDQWKGWGCYQGMPNTDPQFAYCNSPRATTLDPGSVPDQNGGIPSLNKDFCDCYTTQDSSGNFKIVDFWVESGRQWQELVRFEEQGDVNNANFKKKDVLRYAWNGTYDAPWRSRQVEACISTRGCCAGEIRVGTGKDASYPPGRGHPACENKCGNATNSPPPPPEGWDTEG